MLLTFAIASTAAVVTHAIARRLDVTSSLVGDENEYVWRAHQTDPFQPTPFLRMPLFPAVGRLATLGRLDPVRWLVAACALASVAASDWRRRRPTSWADPSRP